MVSRPIPPNHRPPPLKITGSLLGACDATKHRSILLGADALHVPGGNAIGKSWENTGKMIKIMAKWWSDVVKCGESLDETVMKIIKEWPELAKEPRNQLSSCIFVFISWSGSRSLHPKPRCWKMLKDLWLCLDCTMSSQNPTISKYHEIWIIMICYYVSHYISLYHLYLSNMQVLYPQQTSLHRISGIPEPQPVFSLSVHDEPGWIIWINWNQNWILTGA